eukprot:PhF_6_TR40686/c2_g1_i6/m.61149
MTSEQADLIVTVLGIENIPIIPLTVVDIFDWLKTTEVNDIQGASQVFLRQIQRMEPVNPHSIHSAQIGTMQTYFHVACECGHDAFVQAFLNDRERFTGRDDSGTESFYHAFISTVRNGHVSCMCMCLSFDTNMTKIINQHGDSALHYAAGNGHDVCI